MNVVRAMTAHSLQMHAILADSLNKNAELLSGSFHIREDIQKQNTSTEQSKSKSKDNVEDWDVQETVKFLRLKGLDSYTTHFLEMKYNGMVLNSVDESDVQDMPETNTLLRKVFLRLVKNIQT